MKLIGDMNGKCNLVLPTIPVFLIFFSFRKFFVQHKTLQTGFVVRLLLHKFVSTAQWPRCVQRETQTFSNWLWWTRCVEKNGSAQTVAVGSSGSFASGTHSVPYSRLHSIWMFRQFIILAYPELLMPPTGGTQIIRCISVLPRKVLTWPFGPPHYPSLVSHARLAEHFTDLSWRWYVCSKTIQFSVLCGKECMFYAQQMDRHAVLWSGSGEDWCRAMVLPPERCECCAMDPIAQALGSNVQNHGTTGTRNPLAMWKLRSQCGKTRNGARSTFLNFSWREHSFRQCCNSLLQWGRVDCATCVARPMGVLCP